MNRGVDQLITDRQLAFSHWIKSFPLLLSTTQKNEQKILFRFPLTYKMENLRKVVCTYLIKA